MRCPIVLALLCPLLSYGQLPAHRMQAGTKDVRTTPVHRSLTIGANNRNLNLNLKLNLNLNLPLHPTLCSYEYRTLHLLKTQYAKKPKNPV